MWPPVLAQHRLGDTLIRTTIVTIVTVTPFVDPSRLAPYLLQAEQTLRRVRKEHVSKVYYQKI